MFLRYLYKCYLQNNTTGLRCFNQAAGGPVQEPNEGEAKVKN